MPGLCDADGEFFDVNHALNCPRGGLVYNRHNKTRDLNCDLLEKAGLKQVKCEPVITATDENGENGLRADWGVSGFGNPIKWSFMTFVFSIQMLHLSKQRLWNLFLRQEIK